MHIQNSKVCTSGNGVKSCHYVLDRASLFFFHFLSPTYTVSILSHTQTLQIIIPVISFSCFVIIGGKGGYSFIEIFPPVIAYLHITQTFVRISFFNILYRLFHQRSCFFVFFESLEGPTSARRSTAFLKTAVLFSFLGPRLSLPSYDRALTLSRSALVGKRTSDRERESLFPVLVNHISVQFPSVLFGNGGMTGVIYHTD